MRRLWSVLACAIAVAPALAAAQEAATVNKSLVRVIAFKDGKPVMRVLREGKPGDLGRVRPAKVLYTNKGRNLALIEVPGLGAPGLPLPSDAPKQGQRVFLFGYPGADSPSSTLSSGLVQRVVTQKVGAERIVFLQHEANGGPGTGGGPLVNARGAVVGVHGFLLQGGAGLGVVAVEITAPARANNVTWAVAPPCNR